METKQIIVECEIPFLIRTGDHKTDDFDFFSVPTQDYTAKIGFRMVPGGGKENVKIAGGFDEDRLGHMSTTRVKAEFDKEFIESIPNEVYRLPESVERQVGKSGNTENAYVIEEVTKCVNIFIDIYRTNTGSYWMRRLLPHDIFDFDITRVNEEGKKSEQHHKHTASAMTGMAGTLSDKEVSEIKDMLESGEKPSIYSRLQLRVRDYISLGEYDIAVVDSQRLMESWLKEAFEHLLVEVKEYSQSEAEETARHDDGSFKDTYAVKGMYNSKLGFTLEDTTEFQQWDNSAKDLRNDIVHEGYEPTENETVEAVKIHNDLILRVKSEFESTLRSDLLAVEEMPEDGIGRTTMGDE